MSKKTIVDMSENFKPFESKNDFPERWFVMDEDKRDTERLYNELIMAVQSKHYNETRHQTALRYIKEREEMRSITQECRDKEAMLRNKP